jgi:hypothetical protein
MWRWIGMVILHGVVHENKQPWFAGKGLKMNPPWKFITSDLWVSQNQPSYLGKPHRLRETWWPQTKTVYKILHFNWMLSILWSCSYKLTDWHEQLIMTHCYLYVMFASTMQSTPLKTYWECLCHSGSTERKTFSMYFNCIICIFRNLPC